MKRFLGIATGLAVAAGLAFITGYRQDEATGEFGFDPAWLMDAFGDLKMTVWGLILFGFINWFFLPLNWSDARDETLPANVRAASLIAQAVILWAIVSTVGRM